VAPPLISHAQQDKEDFDIEMEDDQDNSDYEESTKPTVCGIHIAITDQF
jgi:hypothetical protein